MAGRTVVIGIDGVPFGIMDELSDKGYMPNFAALKDRGNFSKMHSAVPEVSNVNWSSIVTGKNPGEHGIYGFTDLIEGTYTLSFPDRRSLRASPFWEDREKRYVILNVPAMYPAPDINGTFISGFVSLDLSRSVYPKEILPYLERSGYKIDVDSALAHRSMDLFLEDLFDTLMKRERVCMKYLRERWDCFMVVFTGSDRLGHFLIDAYHDESHKYHGQFLEYYGQVDRIIGDIIKETREEDRIILLSDHGMEPIKKSVNLNWLLQDAGYLMMGDRPDRGYDNMASGTKAFVLDPGRVYLNHGGRYPRGEVCSPEDLLEELTILFKDMRCGGERVIKNVLLKEEVYHGDQIDRAPDIILVPESGYNLKGTLKYDALFEENIFRGKHTEHDAFLYCSDSELPNNPRVEDVRGLIEGGIYR